VSSVSIPSSSSSAQQSTSVQPSQSPQPTYKQVVQGHSVGSPTWPSNLLNCLADTVQCQQQQDKELD
jgi:hypothetical protein